MIHITKPELDTLPPYVQEYIGLVLEPTLGEALYKSLEKVNARLRDLPEAKWNHRYAPDKWSVKELMVHVNDTERILSYRALRFARNDNTPLQGFDESHYGKYSYADLRSGASILSEFQSIRAATLALFEGLPKEAYFFTGKANQYDVSVATLGFFMVGHCYHHLRILNERYL
jgi:hypothetical protein